MIHRVACEVGGRPFSIETGKLARQADGAVLVSYGDTRVLVTACSRKDPTEGIDFFPMTIEFQERYYAAGKIPGSFHRREGRPTQEATLSARLIDRPIRPLFPEGYFHDTQVVATILSVDPEADVDVAAAAGASAALHISDIPLSSATAACRVGKLGGKLVVNPTWSQIDNGESEMDIFVAGTKNAIMMVEGGAREIPETEILEAILLGHLEIKKIAALIDELRMMTGNKPKRTFSPVTVDSELKLMVEKAAKTGLVQALRTKEKLSRYTLVDQIKSSTLENCVPKSLEKENPEKFNEMNSKVKLAFEQLQYHLMREMILSEGLRIDGRDTKTIRSIATETGPLPRTHGSALFTRGETQILAAVTLGTSDDEQIVDTMYQNTMKKFMLHYNFPPFSVGETGRMGGQSRREIGHGALAERSIRIMMPKFDTFPYTVRIVCETLESNGSSSMGSVCSTSMALMDAGVPFSKPVAGIAMGLIKENARVAVLSDILGDEDHLGDMDFKVAGTADGVTGIQMDIKIEGVDENIMRTALQQAKEGRLHILAEMAKTIMIPKSDLSKHAPRITSMNVPVEKIKDVIGSGGKVIKDIVAKTGCKIDISDDGKINIATADSRAAEKAILMIKNIIAEVEVGKIYQGVVKKIVEFGAFVEVLPNQDGLLHISEIAHERVNSVTDFMKEGDSLEVKVIEVDRSGKIRLSRKVLLPGGPSGGGRPNDGGSRGGGGSRSGGGPHGGGGERQRNSQSRSSNRNQD